jgi:hypothetical protein
MTPMSRATTAKIGAFAGYNGGSGIWSGANARRARKSLMAASPSKIGGRFLRFQRESVAES